MGHEHIRSLSTCCALSCLVLALVLSAPARAFGSAGTGAPPPAAPQAAAATLPAEDPQDPLQPEFAMPTTLDRAGRIVAPVEINGRGPFRFILDTGANRSAMSAATAEALGLAPDPNSLLHVHGITGSAVLPSVRVESFRAGDLQFKSQNLPVLPAAVFGGAHGILGIDALQHARIEVDFEQDRVTIRRSSGRPASAGFIVVRARPRHGGLMLVKGKVGSIPVKAILDTGAERSLGNEALRVALNERARRPKEGVVTKVYGATDHVAEGTSFEASAIKMGNAQLNNLTVTFGDLHVFKVWSLQEEPTLVVGMDLLGTLKLFVVDYRRREFHFKPWNNVEPGSTCGRFICSAGRGGG